MACVSRPGAVPVDADNQLTVPKTAPVAGKQLSLPEVRNVTLLHQTFLLTDLFKYFVLTVFTSDGRVEASITDNQKSV